MSTITLDRPVSAGTARTKQYAFITPQSMLKGSNAGGGPAIHTAAAALVAALTDGETTHWSGYNFQQFDDHPTQSGAYAYTGAFSSNNAPWFDATNTNVFAPLERWNHVRSARGSNGRGTLVVFGDPGWSHPVETTGTTAIGATTINVVNTQSAAHCIPNSSASSAEKVLTNAAGDTITYTGTGTTTITGVTGVTTALPAGTKLWQKQLNSATDNWAIAAPSFIPQRVADLIHFLEQAKIANGGVMPFGAILFRQEHKGRIANGLGTGRAWEALDRDPAHWTPTDDNGHLSFFPWVHVKYWNAMFLAIRGHADTDISGLLLLGPYIAYGGVNPWPLVGGVPTYDATADQHHLYPLGSADGAIPPWEWDDQAHRYFFKYAMKDALCGAAIDYSARDNNDTHGVSADDTYVWTSVMRFVDLVSVTRATLAEFGWPDWIELSEAYYWVNISGCDTSYTEPQQAAYELMLHIVLYKLRVQGIHEWQKSGDTVSTGGRQTNKCSWLRQDFDVTATTNGSSGNSTNTGPGTKFLAWDAINALRAAFPVGTPMITSTSDDPALFVIASSAKALVVNVRSTPTTFTLDGSSRTLAGYAWATYSLANVGLNDTIADVSDSLAAVRPVTPRGLFDTIASISDVVGVRRSTAAERRPRAHAAMRMTDQRFALDKTAWPGSRTTVTDYAGLVAALAAGQKVTLGDGATFTGVDLHVPSFADVRSNTYLGSTINCNLILDDATDVVLGGFRLGAGRSILGARTKRSRLLWILAGGGGTTDYGIRLTDPSGVGIIGCFTRNYRAYGIALIDSSGVGNLVPGFERCAVRHSRWEAIGHTVPVLDGVTEVGLRLEVPTLVDAVEGQGSAWAEVSIASSDVEARNLRLYGARIGVDLVGSTTRTSLTSLRIAPSLYGIQTNQIPAQGGTLVGGLIRDVFVDGGVIGINLERPDNPVVDNMNLRGQTSASLRQHAGNALIDFAFSDIAPAPGGVAFLYQP